MIFGMSSEDLSVGSNLIIKKLWDISETKINDTRTQQQYLQSLQEDREYTARKWPSLKGNVPTRSLVVDIFHNATRRAFEGKFDDAIARLYRCLEMIGQYALLEYSVVSSEADLTALSGKIPENTFKKLAARLEKNGKLRLGLVEDLEIISELNKEDPLAIIYRKYNEDFKKYILIRNKSILAHGIKPVSKDEYLKLESMSKVFIQSVIHSVDEEISKINRCFDYKILEP